MLQIKVEDRHPLPIVERKYFSEAEKHEVRRKLFCTNRKIKRRRRIVESEEDDVLEDLDETYLPLDFRLPEFENLFFSIRLYGSEDKWDTRSDQSYRDAKRLRRHCARIQLPSMNKPPVPSRLRIMQTTNEPQSDLTFCSRSPTAEYKSRPPRSDEFLKAVLASTRKAVPPPPKFLKKTFLEAIRDPFFGSRVVDGVTGLQNDREAMYAFYQVLCDDVKGAMGQEIESIPTKSLREARRIIQATCIEKREGVKWNREKVDAFDPGFDIMRKNRFIYGNAALLEPGPYRLKAGECDDCVSWAETTMEKMGF